MKKLIISLYSIFTICIFASCGQREPSDEMEVQPNDISIADTWVYVRSTEGEGEEPLEIYEFSWFLPQLVINKDGTTTARFYESTVYGEFVHTEDNNFAIINQTAYGEGEKWYPEDEVLLSYDPESGLLRYSIVNPTTVLRFHHYFVRESVADIQAHGLFPSAYRIYHDILSKMSWEYDDRIYVDFIDFNNIGFPELFIYINPEISYVMGFSVSNGFYLEWVDHGFYPPQLSIDTDPQDSASAWYSLSIDQNGQYYLVYYVFTSAGESYRYYTVRDGQWDMVLAMNSGFNADRPELPNDWERYYEINGNFVDIEEWENAPMTELSIVNNYGFPRHENNIYDILDEIELKRDARLVEIIP